MERKRRNVKMELIELSKECKVNCAECEEFEQCCYLVNSKKDELNQKGEE